MVSWVLQVEITKIGAVLLLRKNSMISIPEPSGRPKSIRAKPILFSVILFLASLIDCANINDLEE